MKNGGWSEEAAATYTVTVTSVESMTADGPWAGSRTVGLLAYDRKELPPTQPNYTLFSIVS
jgi:hypothetical protein